MKKIASFTINHDTLRPGFYTSRTDGDVVTYDLRTTVPNQSFMSNDEMHTFEHLFATYTRNSRHEAEIIYFGPMGCRTGFYLLVRDSVTPQQVLDLTRETLGWIAAYEGEIPGSQPRECANAAEHSLPQAKALAARMADVMSGWTLEQLAYLP